MPIMLLAEDSTDNDACTVFEFPLRLTCTLLSDNESISCDCPELIDKVKLSFDQWLELASRVNHRTQRMNSYKMRKDGFELLFLTHEDYYAFARMELAASRERETATIK